MTSVQRFAALAVFATVAALSVPAHFVAYAQGTRDLAAGWSVNEGAGTSIGDSFGSQTAIVDGATWTAGKYGQTLSFNGIDSVTIGDFDLAGPFTVMAWMQTRSLVTGGCASLVMKPLDYGFEICQGRLHAGVGTGTTWTAYASQPLSAADLNVWKHVALTYDGTTLRFYIGGALIASAAGGHVSNSNALALGRWTGGEFWNGLIDEVSIQGTSTVDPAVPDADEHRHVPGTTGLMDIERDPDQRPRRASGRRLELRPGWEAVRDCGRALRPSAGPEPVQRTREDPGFASMWSKGFSSPFTAGATATGNSSTWIGKVIAFKRAP